MSGGYFAVAPCYVCRRTFAFNPELVPSVPIDPDTWLPLDVDGEGRAHEIDPEARKRAIKQPLCERCIEQVNERRVERGQEPIDVLPGAYDFVEGLPP